MLSNHSKTPQNQIDQKGTPHVFVGYPFGTKGYRVLNLTTHRIHVPRDVVFHETVFPFSMIDKSHSNTLASSFDNSHVSTVEPFVDLPVIPPNNNVHNDHESTEVTFPVLHQIFHHY